ncbi:MAG: hypothetical protein RQ824_04365 [bacterium]|nr:hypothetical protein [bacterium]
MNLNVVFNITLGITLILMPTKVGAFFNSERTGGMSEIYIADSSVKVAGGFIDRYSGNSISVRAKGLEISLNIDNSSSDEGKTFDFTVNNINAEITEIVGWAGDDLVKEGNSLKFEVNVEARKVRALKLAPKLADDNFKFIVFGESKGGRHVFKRVLGDINYRKPLFAISCGDMLEDSSKKEYDRFLKDIGEVNVPFLTVAGRSELQDGGMLEYEDALGASYYSFDFKNSHFVVLSNGEGRISEEQFLWLENDLMLNKALNTFVFMHLPAFDPRPARKQPMLFGGQHLRLIKTFEKYNVSMVFSAGIASYFRDARAGTTYIVTGGGGSELASADAFHNYIIVEVSADKVKDNVVKLVSPPLSWSAAISLKARLYFKNSFQTHPVRTSIYTILLSLILLLIFRAIYIKLFRGERKRKLSL